jgi:hypothetical protein
MNSTFFLVILPFGNLFRFVEGWINRSILYFGISQTGYVPIGNIKWNIGDTFGESERKSNSFRGANAASSISH